MGQDWSTVTFSSRPTSAAASSAQKQQGLKEAQRSGAAIETSAKFGGGGNKQATAASAKARQLEEMTDVGEGVPPAPPRLEPPAGRVRACGWWAGGRLEEGGHQERWPVCDHAICRSALQFRRCRRS